MDNEKNIEQYFKRRVEKHGALAWKFNSSQSGVPDRVVLFSDNTCCFAEIKAPGKTLRPLQLAVKRSLERRGFKVWVIDSREKVEAFLDYYFRGGERREVQPSSVPAGSDPPAADE